MSIAPSWGGESPAYEVRHEADGTSMSVAVTEAIANVRGVDSREIGFVLADVIDPDALDRLFEEYADEYGQRWEFTFAVDGYQVTVRSDGRIRIDD